MRVINVRGLKGAGRRGVVYCGRPFAGWVGHALANPFKPKPYGNGGASQTQMDLHAERERAECIAKYRAYLLARPTLEADLAALWEECQHGALPLGCWCAPDSCHCDVLAELLTERYEVQPCRRPVS